VPSQIAFFSNKVEIHETNINARYFPQLFLEHFCQLPHRKKFFAHSFAYHAPPAMLQTCRSSDPLGELYQRNFLNSFWDSFSVFIPKYLGFVHPGRSSPSTSSTGSSTFSELNCQKLIPTGQSRKCHSWQSRIYVAGPFQIRNRLPDKSARESPSG
jgi:hypothetical protein